MKRDLIKPLHGLRGIAALTVVFGHYGIVTSTPSLGVVLFFILSGFLIGKLYVERPFNTKEVSSYVVARFARIYPLFALVVVGTGVLNMAFPSAEVFYLEPDQIVPHLLLFGSNMTIWTICAEFQFYLFSSRSGGCRPSRETYGGSSCQFSLCPSPTVHHWELGRVERISSVICTCSRSA
ncbi:acyltransferase family protein [Porphyrobacter algicida]|uniref:Acyltransferase family protein n=1 Tax=Qipengyuania algicida TaxID=1836209 RepID=A0A845AGR7_9SPHN|nr:acyltransferase [Qipengyuania algicida]MXP28657.1 acyltransferase family protein [Qipengyuania algicida]